MWWNKVSVVYRIGCGGYLADTFRACTEIYREVTWIGDTCQLAGSRCRTVSWAKLNLHSLLLWTCCCTITYGATTNKRVGVDTIQLTSVRSVQSHRNGLNWTALPVQPRLQQSIKQKNGQFIHFSLALSISLRLKVAHAFSKTFVFYQHELKLVANNNINAKRWVHLTEYFPK